MIKQFKEVFHISYMKKVTQTNREELRPEYKLEDFTGGLVRGKYALSAYNDWTLTL